MLGLVYLICDPSNETYKIGVTRNSDNNRLKLLLTGNSTKLHIVTSYLTYYPFRLETMLHNAYKNKRAEGEWFYLDSIDVLNFQEECKKYNNIIESLLNNVYFSKNLK